MARNKSPAYQHYPADELSDSDIIALTLEEYGSLKWIENLLWLNDFLDYEEKKLAKILKISPKKFRKNFLAIEKFFKIEDGKIRSPKLDEERQKQAEWRLKSSAGGKESVRKRREKVKGGSEMDQRVVEPKLNSSTSSSTSTSKKHTPLLSQIENLDGNGFEAENPVCVKNGSKFSEEERRKYIQSQHWSNNPEGWLIKSKSGCFDKQIEKWVKNPRPMIGINGAGVVKSATDVCKYCKKHDDFPADVKPCPYHQADKFLDWKRRQNERIAANSSLPLVASST